MIVEIRTYRLRPGSVQRVEDLFRDHLPHRTHLSPLGGLWHTVSGELDTVIHLWPYDTIQQRMEIREQMMQPPRWPPPLRDFLLDMDSRIFLPELFSPPIVPASHGTLYEFCTDSMLPGGVGECARDWSKFIERRAQISPLVFCGTSEFGKLNQWLHIWAYRNAAHRECVHARLRSEGWWPPAGGREKLQRQESFLAAPAECSPLR